jgi:hypothetical protein
MGTQLRGGRIPPKLLGEGNRKGHADSTNAIGAGAKPFLSFQQGAEKEATVKFVLTACALSARRLCERLEHREIPIPAKPDKPAAMPAGIDG